MNNRLTWFLGFMVRGATNDRSIMPIFAPHPLDLLRDSFFQINCLFGFHGQGHTLLETRGAERGGDAPFGISFT
jgi:hypothetical protein